MSKQDFKTKKSLGQNFLIDEEIKEEIAAACGAGPDDLVIEIGPGLGAVTELLERSAGHVIAVELDDRLIPILRAKFFDGKVEILHADILQVDFEELLAGREYSKLYAVGNLPYYITTPILLGLMEKNLPAERIVVMVQKEVAEKMLATPGSGQYGVLSLFIQYYYEPSLTAEVPADCFDPAPKVDSAVVTLNVRKDRRSVFANPSDVLEEFYFALIRQAFVQRRKTLQNSLAGYRGIAKEQLGAILEECGIENTRRAETLSVLDFAKLAEKIYNVL